MGSFVFLQVLPTWIGFALLAALVGVGLRARVMRAPTEDADDWMAAFWSGWCVIVAFLQIFHLAHRIDAFAFAAVVILALAGLWLGRDDVARTLRKGMRGRVGLVAFTMISAGWLATSASNMPGNFDSGLYHIQAIKWTNACAIVPGLGNFHYRLAYNNSSFLFAALMQVPPPHQAVHTASGLLILGMTFQLLIGLRRLMRQPDALRVTDVVTLALAPAILLQLLEQPWTVDGWSPSWNPFPPSNASSPTPDLVVYALGVAVAPLTVALLWGETKGDRGRATLLTLATLVLVGITVKLSFAVFGCACLAIAAFAWWRDAEDRREVVRVAWVLLALGLLSVGVWIVRGIILSGYFAYPAHQLGSLRVPWRVPLPVVVEDYRSMQGWARNPGAPAAALDNWRWVDDWYAREFAYFRRLGLPFTIAFCALGLALLTAFARPARRWRVWLIVLPPVAATLFWFVTMPVNRYLGSTAWCAAALGVALALAHLDRRAAATGVALLSLYLSLDSFHAAPTKTMTNATGFERLYISTGQPYRTDSGLWIRALGSHGMQPWDGELLLTPSPQRSLRQRKVAELCSGFESK